MLLNQIYAICMAYRLQKRPEFFSLHLHRPKTLTSGSLDLDLQMALTLLTLVLKLNLKYARMYLHGVPGFSNSNGIGLNRDIYRNRNRQTQLKI